MNVSNRIVALAVVGWGVCIVGAFWHYEWRYLRPVPRPSGAAEYALNRWSGDLPEAPLAALDSAQGSVSLRGDNPVTLINFWNPSCACSQFVEPHVRSLIRDFRFDGVRFVTVVECGSSVSEQMAAAAEWCDRNMPTMPIVVDPGGSIARSFGVWAAPGAVILNQQNRIAYIGSYNAARFCADPATAWAMQALQAILSNRRPPRRSTPFYGCQVVGR